MGYKLQVTSVIMINDFIKKLQGSSDRTKEKILWSVVAVSVVMSLAIWSLSIESYKAVLNQPLDTGMMEGLKASVTQLESQKSIKSESPIGDDITEQMIDKELANAEGMDDPAVASVEAMAGKAEEDEIKYNRLPVDED